MTAARKKTGRKPAAGKSKGPTVPSHLTIGCAAFTGSRHSYHREFPVVEVPDVFLHPPHLDTLESWRNEAPKEFSFVVPAWQLVTHRAHSHTYKKLRMPVPQDRRERFGHLQNTDEVRAAWDLSVKCAEALKAKVLVVQTPADFRHSTENEDRVQQFFTKAVRGSARIAWEPHESWPVETVEKICDERKLIAAGDPFGSRWRGEPFRYFRLHGRAGHGIRYGNDDLATLAEICADPKPAYVIFGNAQMAGDAVRFRKLVSSRKGKKR